MYVCIEINCMEAAYMCFIGIKSILSYLKSLSEISAAEKKTLMSDMN